MAFSGLMVHGLFSFCQFCVISCWKKKNLVLIFVESLDGNVFLICFCSKTLIIMITLLINISILVSLECFTFTFTA